jgi:hypothetical protein
MSFLISLLIQGYFWTGVVSCKDATHCSVSYAIAQPLAKPVKATDCTSFSLASQAPISTAASGKTIAMSCAVSGSNDKLSAKVN